jgi:hypothetical protein
MVRSRSTPRRGEANAGNNRSTVQTTCHRAHGAALREIASHRLSRAKSDAHDNAGAREFAFAARMVLDA